MQNLTIIRLANTDTAERVAQKCNHNFEILQRALVPYSIKDPTAAGADNISSLEGALGQHLQDFNNPHKTDKSHVGLGNVDNTADMDKPVSTLVSDALNTKLNADKIRSGYAMVAPNENTFHVFFATMPATPFVQLTARTEFACAVPFWVANVNATGFDILTSGDTSNPRSYNWLAICN